MDDQDLNKHVLAKWTFNEGDFRTALDSVNHIEDSINYVFHQAAFQPDKTVKRRKGIHGKALWFDGFSTYIKRETDLIELPRNSFTISLWIAPHSFGGIEDDRLTAIINQHSYKDKKGFILGFHKHGKLSFQVGLNNGWTELWCENQNLQRNKWSMVTATFDSERSLLELYINGILHAKKDLQPGTYFNPAKENLLIGKNNKPFMVEEIFALNMFSGLMDQVTIYQNGLLPSEVQKEYNLHLKGNNFQHPYLDLETNSIQREDFSDDIHKPQFHVTAPGHWMNEPHTPFYFKGKYHLFYQHNPQGPYWGNIHWGHWVSDDLVHWKDLPVALSPERGEVDPDGTWSGNAHYDQEGNPLLFFTAGNQRFLPNQMIGVANSSFKNNGDIDLKTWEKWPEPVLFQPEGLNLDDDGFRDPFIWKEEGTWYQLVGSGIYDKGGTALLFESNNVTDWTFVRHLYLSDYNKYPYLGTVWELPILLPLGKNQAGLEKHIFIISPVGERADVEVFYWLGIWNKKDGKFIPDHEEPKLFDLGDFHFTGPSAMIDPVSGRLIIFTIAQGERPIEYEYAAGWAHNGGLPAEIFLDENDEIGIKPIEELMKLRKYKRLDLSNVTLSVANQSLMKVKGDMLEIEIELESSIKEQFGLFIRQSPDSREETLLYYDESNEGFYVDRRKTTLDKKEKSGGIQGGKVQLKNQPLSLKIFLDKSMIEAYINERNSLTTRVYPTLEDSQGLSLKGDKHLMIKRLSIWEMKGIH